MQSLEQPEEKQKKNCLKRNKDCLEKFQYFHDLTSIVRHFSPRFTATFTQNKEGNYPEVEGLHEWCFPYFLFPWSTILALSRSLVAMNWSLARCALSVLPTKTSLATEGLRQVFTRDDLKEVKDTGRSYLLSVATLPPLISNSCFSNIKPCGKEQRLKLKGPWTNQKQLSCELPVT